MTFSGMFSFTSHKMYIFLFRIGHILHSWPSYKLNSLTFDNMKGFHSNMNLLVLNSAPPISMQSKLATDENNILSYCITGRIKVDYKMNTFNIPISITLSSRDYPTKPPILRVQKIKGILLPLLSICRHHLSWRQSISRLHYWSDSLAITQTMECGIFYPLSSYPSSPFLSLPFSMNWFNVSLLSFLLKKCMLLFFDILYARPTACIHLPPSPKDSSHLPYWLQEHPSPLWEGFWLFCSCL